MKDKVIALLDDLLSKEAAKEKEAAATGFYADALEASIKYDIMRTVMVKVIDMEETK